MKSPRYRWLVLVIFSFFILLHQADRLLISPLTTPIMEEFGINESQMGLVFSGAIIVGAVFYPLWGYLYDRYTRSRLLALAAFLWGATTWLSATVRSFTAFIFTRASTGIDDSSYPGVYSLLSDYFDPSMRGKAYGALQTAMPLGYLLGMLLATAVGGAYGWRSVFYVTGLLGIVISLLILVFVKEAPRGAAEPELAEAGLAGMYHFRWSEVRELFRKKSLIFLFIQGFFGVFPWQVVTFWFFRYLEVERSFSPNQVLSTMGLAVVFLAAGYPLGGALGDWLFRRTRRGRLYVSAAGVLIGAVLLWFTLNIPNENLSLFMAMMCFTALFMPFASANVLSTVHDITPPEIRSSANAIQNLIEQAGSATAPALAGWIASVSTLGNAILYISTGAWLLCFIFFIGAILFVEGDIQALREQLRQRAALGPDVIQG